MHIRDMSFGELTKVGFWLAFAPALFFLVLIALIMMIFGLAMPAEFAHELEIDSINPIAVIFGGLLITLILSAFVAFASLIEAVIGAVFVRLYTYMFMGARHDRDI